MNRNRRITYLKRTATAAVCFSLTAVNALPVMAAESPEKEENVYASLADDGTVEGIYVVNEYDLEKDTKITDYGDYTEVTNLSSEDEITENGNEYTVEGRKGKFYYQGNLESKALPWEISISYYLDGEKISADDLAGKSGSLEIRISIKKNEDVKGDYFDNYLLQTTVTLDSEKCKDIQAEDATVANVGSDKQILYNIMAGQEKEISITAEVTDFEMSGIAFQGVPMSFAIDTDSLDLSELYDRTDELKDATVELDDGASVLKDGTAELADGSGQLLDAVRSLTGGAGSLVSGVDGAASGGSGLVSGSREIDNGISSYLAGVSSASSGGASLSDAVRILKNGTGSLTDGTSQLKSGTLTYTAGVDSYVDGTQQYVEGVNSLYEGTKQLEGLKDLGQVSAGVSELSGSTQQLLAGAGELSDGLGALQEQLHAIDGMADAEQLEELIGKIKELSATLGNMRTEAEKMIGQYNEAAEKIGEAAQIISQAEDELQAEAESAGQQLDDAGAELTGQVGSANSQISKANEALSSAASSTNSQIDQAIAAVREAMSSGAIDEATGNSLIADMEESKVQVQSADSVSVTIPDTDVSISGNISGQLDDIASELEQIQSGTTETLTTISDEMRAALLALNNIDMSSINNLRQLTESVDALKEGADQLEAGLSQMSQGLIVMEEQTAALPEAAEGIGSLLDGFETLNEQNDALIEGGNTLKTSSGALNQGAEDVDSGAAQLDAGAESMAQGMEELNAGLKELEEKGADLESGSGSLTQGAEALLSGLARLQAGVETLSSGASAFESGVSSLADGAEELDNGAAEMKDGTAQFRSETADIDDEIEAEIDQMIEEFSGRDYVPASFVSDMNTNVEAVQFAFQTDPISVEKETPEEAEEEPESFWDKIKGLFE